MHQQPDFMQHRTEKTTCTTLRSCLSTAGDSYVFCV